MNHPVLPKPSMAFTKDLYSPSLSSRASSTDKLSSLPENLLPSTAASSNSSEVSIPTATNQHSQEVHLKTQLLSPHYKSLPSHYSKFQHKTALPAKANHLRLTLLKFLRFNIQFQLSVNVKDTLPQHTIAKVTQFTQTAIQYFMKYWVSLLLELFKNWSAFSHVDRTCYLECLSRLMSRREWFVNTSCTKVYQELLILTINFIFRVLLNLKTIPLSLNAFIGKVFAFGYLVVPNFSQILLFTLFVKNRSIYKVLSSLDHNEKTIKSSVYPEHLTDLINFQGDFQLNDETDPRLMNINCMKPPKVSTSFYTETLTENFEGEFEELEKYDELHINLKDTNWVKKWASFDSDIFKSFLKHFLELSLFYQNSGPEFEIDDPDDFLFSFIAQQPGGILIYTHVVEIFDSNFSMLKNFKTCQYKESNSPQMKNEMAAFYASMKNPGPGKNYQSYMNQISFLKMLRVLQTIIYTSSESMEVNHNENEALIIKYFESVLLLKAKSVSPYNPESCEVLYDLFLQLCLHLGNQKNNFALTTSLSSLKSLKFLHAIDWKFWVLGLTRMLSTENMISQAKALTSFFNLWDLIPVDYELEEVRSVPDVLENPVGNGHWILDARYSLLHNISVFLVSNSTWKRLFIHWQPLIRHFYIRLVMFKIVKREPSSSLNIIVKKRLEETYSLFIENYEKSDYDDQLLRFELKPSMPIFGKKLIVTHFSSSPISTKQSLIKNSRSYVDMLDFKSRTDSKSSSLSSLIQPLSSKNNITTSNLVIPSSSQTVYAFDIFDDAVYSSSSYSSRQPSSSLASKSSSSPSLPRSFSRSSLKSLTSSLKPPRAASSSSLPSPQRSPSVSRSSSSSALNKVPILGSALSFFKKNPSSTPTIQEPPQIINPTTPPQSTTEEILRTPILSTTGATPRSSPSHRNVSYYESGYSPSSSVSEISDEDRQSQIFIAKRSDNHRSCASPTAFISSLNTNTTATPTNINSMDSIPSPPELQVKIPEVKSFKYKYQMVSSTDSFQSTLFCTKLNDTDRKFFKADEVLNLDDMIPKKPRLPFSSKSLNPGSALRFFATDSSESLPSEEEEDDLLHIQDSRLAQWLSTSKVPVLAPQRPKTSKSNVPFKADSKLYEGISSWQILGKVLNEWESVVDEYEKYSELVSSEMSQDYGSEIEDQWFWSPMLICDIPPSKSLYKD